MRKRAFQGWVMRWCKSIWCPFEFQHNSLCDSSTPHLAYIWTSLSHWWGLWVCDEILRSVLGLERKIKVWVINKNISINLLGKNLFGWTSSIAPGMSVLTRNIDLTFVMFSVLATNSNGIGTPNSRTCIHNHDINKLTLSFLKLQMSCTIDLPWAVSLLPVVCLHTCRLHC